VFLVPLEHREIDDPGERKAVLPHELELFADARARGARKLRGVRLLAGGKEHGVARAHPGGGGDLPLDLGWHELGDRALAAFGIEDDVAEPTAAHLALRPVIEPVEP